MGVAARDWYGEQPRPKISRATTIAAIVFVVAGLVLLAANTWQELSQHGLSAGAGPALSGSDPWKRYLADDRTCPTTENVDTLVNAQTRVMICLINFARQQRGLNPLAVSTKLSVAARLKAEAIAHCRVFSHAPCGSDPHGVAVPAGYTGSWGENLYLGNGRLAAARRALDRWLNSPEHRANLFRPGWKVQSIYVVKLGSFPGYTSSPTLWVSEFGDRP